MRLEEKENDLKREYNKLHERYTEVNTNFKFAPFRDPHFSNFF